VQNDKSSLGTDEPNNLQIKAIYGLVKELMMYFNMTQLGGHREFAQAHGSSRACPGTYGMALAQMVRNEMGLKKP
jgi:hypothetical protein